MEKMDKSCSLIGYWLSRRFLLLYLPCNELMDFENYFFYYLPTAETAGDSRFGLVEVLYTVNFLLLYLIRFIMSGSPHESQFSIIKVDKTGTGEMLRISFQPST